MKVYLINANWAEGGPGGIVKDLYYRLVEKNHDVRFAYARGSITDDVNSYKFGVYADVLFHAAMTRIFDCGGFLSSFSTIRLIRDIEKYKPDVINIHNPLGYTINVKMLFDFIRKSEIPTFFTLHDCWLFSGHCTTDICEKLNSTCGHCPSKHEFPASYVFDCSRANIKKKRHYFSDISNMHLISPCKWMYELANNSYLKKNINTVIYNGIDLSVFKKYESNFREEYNLKGKKVILGVASVWSKRKGGKYFEELSKFLDEDYVIVLVGKKCHQKSVDYPI